MSRDARLTELFRQMDTGGKGAMTVDEIAERCGNDEDIVEVGGAGMGREGRMASMVLGVASFVLDASPSLAPRSPRAGNTDQRFPALAPRCWK